MARNWSKWDREEYDLAEKLYNAGLTYREIGQRMGKTRDQARSACNYLEVTDTSRPLPHARKDWPEIDRIITDCVEVEGMAVPQVVQRLAALGKTVCRESVLKRLKRMPEVHREAKRNAAKKRAAASRLYWARQRAKRQQEAAA